jgi:hypothetical protein
MPTIEEPSYKQLERSGSLGLPTLRSSSSRSLSLLPDPVSPLSKKLEAVPEPQSSPAISTKKPSPRSYSPTKRAAMDQDDAWVSCAPLPSMPCKVIRVSEPLLDTQLYNTTPTGTPTHKAKQNNGSDGVGGNLSLPASPTHSKEGISLSLPTSPTAGGDGGLVRSNTSSPRSHGESPTSCYKVRSTPRHVYHLST